jgi:signal transduction histidine kinase
VVDDLMKRVQDMSLDLRPPMLDDLGLLASLLWLFQRCAAQTNVQVNFEHTEVGRRFASEVETAAYRIVQEALTNVGRHAGVKHATVRLWADDSMLGVQIEDQGIGFDVSATPVTTLGLTGMRERALALGGQLTVESSPGRGTRVMAELPLHVPIEQRSLMGA